MRGELSPPLAHWHSEVLFEDHLEVWDIGKTADAFYFWVGRGFSLRRTREEWPSGRFWRTLVLPFLFANWCVWVPVTIVVFLFPLPLRVHIVGFASAFWTLMCLRMGRT